MGNLAVIPARGGSKRLPRKNILPFRGKPIVLWTCEAAQESGLFDCILVSTEDEEIAQVVDKAGFQVDVRPQSLATDISTCAEVCLELLDRLEEQGMSFSLLCCLYATAPLRTARDIASTIALFDDPQTNFACALTRYNLPPHQMLYENMDGWLVAAWPLVAQLKTQGVPEPVIGNGSTYAVRVEAFRRYKSFYGPHTRGYMMSKMRSIDIDTAEDLEMALAMAQWLKNNEEPEK